LRKVLQVLSFFPRGGSAQVVRYLARAIVGADWSTRIVAGSLGGPDDPGNARAFFGSDADLVVVPYDDAVRAADPSLASPPMHPSYEDRPGAPDRILAGLDARAARHLVDEWTRILDAPGVLDGVELAHLHHLTPVHEAIARLRPELPVVTHLHGTELLMLDEADHGAVWPHEVEWRQRMRGWAQRSSRVIVSSDPSRQDAERLLGIDPARMVVVPNGVDLRLFSGPPATAGQREDLFRRWLCDAPRGWSSRDARPGSVRYSSADIAPLLDPQAVIALYVGRFTAVKRTALLVRAHAIAREGLGRPLPLLFAGGSPGEWEGEHPADAAARSPWGHEIFFAGWRSHAELAQLLARGDFLAVPSVAERFGQVYVEAMAMGLPVIACDVAAPPTYIDGDPRSPRRSGWLVPPDDEQALAHALVAAASHRDERALRGENGRHLVRKRFSWDHIALSVADVYAAALDD
jgi:glycosyltransferase involved in cell wall biosynthesis